MINRVLIRIKVVQALYSYLLVRSEFTLPEVPGVPSRDNKFAARVYPAILLFILRLCGYNTVNPLDSKASRRTATPLSLLAESVMARSLYDNTQLRAVMMRRDPLMELLDTIVEPVADAIKQSSAYRSFTRKRNHELPDEIDFWLQIIDTVLKDNQKLADILRNDEGFTLTGMNRGIDLAIATLQSYSDNRALLRSSRQLLNQSLDKAWELYHALLLLPSEIVREQERRIDNARNKYLATESELNPDMRFVDNLAAKALAENVYMQAYEQEHPMRPWADEPALIEHLLDSITACEAYREYMAQKGENTLLEDALLWRTLMRTIIITSDDLAQTMEQRSMLWNDDIHITGTFVMKTLKRLSEMPSMERAVDMHLLPQYKDEEDAAFGRNLFDLAVKDYARYNELINKFSAAGNWDADRLSFIDRVIMVTALAEIMNFPSVPIPVSLNEYIEIANAYSSPQSGKFINGILYAVLRQLKEDGELQKELILKESPKNQ